jgi:hypothetical protein
MLANRAVAPRREPAIQGQISWWSLRVLLCKFRCRGGAEPRRQRILKTS